MNDDTIDGLILRSLLYSETYFRKVLPFIKSEYFSELAHRNIFERIEEYSKKYNGRPSKEALIIEIEKSSIDDDTFTECVDLLNSYHDNKNDEIDEEWLYDESERFCQDRAFYNVLMDASECIDKEDRNVSKYGLPEKFADALAITFDNSIGHDFLEDFESRYEFYHQTEERIPFDIDMFNKITRGGLPLKSLTCYMSSNTGGFKSGTMCHQAAAALSQGEDVLYITMEMAEERIAERIDANLLNVSLDDLDKLPRDMYYKKVEQVRKKTPGKLIIKQYPTSSAHAGHFRFLLRELKLKKNFKPKMIFVDYLNICASSRLAPSAASNSYLYIKAIAEELRGLAVEFNVALVTATQGGRQVAGASDVSIADVSESYGLPATCDLFIGIITTEELDELGQIVYKQLKNRYSDPSVYRTFAVGVEKAKMRLHDLDESASTNLGRDKTQESAPSHIADKIVDRSSGSDKRSRSKFAEFQV